MKKHSFRNFSLVATFIMLLAFGTVASAKSDIGFKGVGPRIGFVDPEGGLDGTIEFGAAFEFGEFAPQLYWDGSASFWSTGREYRYFNDNYNWTLRDLVLRSGVNYHFTEGEWEPYAGGGLGLHFYSWDYSGSPSFNNANDNKIGIYIDGGIEHEFSADTKGQLQLQFDFAEPDQTALLFNLIFNLK